MKTDSQLVLLLEELGANAWPSYIQQTIRTWRLRASFGVTKRANSVYAAGPFPDENWLALVEEFYQRRSIVPAFQVGSASPPELDSILEANGYRIEYPCFLMMALCSEIINRVRDEQRFTCTLAEEADDEWIRDFLILEDYPQEQHRGYSHIFSAIGPSKAFLRLYENDEVIGLGTAVVERSWSGLSNIIVSPRHRQKGAAAQIIRRLTRWAAGRGAERTYLQVLTDNEPALALYDKLGFTAVSQYHYRTLE
ncbi:GNAT family N-acetyltransferase [Aneurinibacillus sp. Ricciae_BoGa-3]|uniref:GNAT family N-acetyltransferase n=1 Tax=Aneurinibacillus sp. Ricciae_BoGa-3 TaxID=3022697 RepID=UPI002340A585|nr:GNAT family N-acetyltransferase [Aneurinibacillus sp. Ricciae_BoGa-3]WCK52444.1 GNAT family N-acetyltransferase [Aneurinibacillus sp. Ricciae_BoGa-3]